MKYIFIVLSLICFIHSKEPATSCSMEGSVSYEGRSLDECRELSVDEGNQCCVVVQAMYGKNSFYCSQFDANATESDIKRKIKEDVIKYHEKYTPGVMVRAKASCKGDVEPYSFSKCTAMETQRNEQFGNCTNFEKNSEYCCLFSAQVMENENVYFCEEVNMEQSKDMENTTLNIDRHYEMHDVKYLGCSPEIIPDTPDTPEKSTSYGFCLNHNLVLFAYLFMLLL